MAALDEIIQRSKTTPPPSTSPPSNDGQSSSALSNIIQRSKAPTQPLPAPPDPGSDIRRSATSQARSAMRESALAPGGGPIRYPAPLSKTLGMRTEQDEPTTTGKIVDAIAPTAQMDPADLISPMGGATQRAAKGVGSWFLRRWGLGGFVDDAAEQVGKAASGVADLGKGVSTAAPAPGPPPPTPFEMRTAPAPVETQVLKRSTTQPPKALPPASAPTPVEGPLPAPATPTATPAPKPTLQQELGGIGYEVSPSTQTPVGGTVSLSQPSAISTYPALKRVAQSITRRRLREAEIQRELTTLSQSAPTPSNVTRAEKLQSELDTLAQSRSKKNLTSADEDEILSTLQRMDDELPRAELGAAQYAAKTPKARRMSRQQAVESIDESTRGPEFAPPLEPKQPTGGVIPRISKSGLREPPSGKPPTGPPTPDKFSATPTPRETVKSPGMRSSLYRPQQVLRSIGGAAADIADNIERGLAQGRLSGARRFYRLRKQGLLELSDQEAVNVSDILQTGGKAQPTSPRAKAVADEARSVLDEIAQEARSATPGDDPIMIRAQDGSMQVFTPRKNYFPHHIPAAGVLGDSKSHLRRSILDDAVRRGDFDSLDEATTALDEYVQFVSKKTDRPKTLLSYFKRKNPSLGERDILKLLDRMRTPPGKYGALEQHRTLDLPFYDPHAGRALDFYVKHASRRLALTKELGQQGEKINDALRRINKSVVEGPATPDQVAKTVNQEVDKLLDQIPEEAAGKDWAAWSALARTWQAFKIGPLTAIPNMFQDTLFGLMKTDFPTVAKGIGRTLTKQGRERAYEAGADMSQAIQLARAESGQVDTAYLSSRAREMGPGTKRAIYAAGGKLQEHMGQLLTHYMNWNAFGKSELWQRALGHNIGEVWAAKMGKRLLHNLDDEMALAALKELNLDPVKIASQGGKFSDDDAMLAGMRMSDLLNFSNRPEDMPSFIQASGAKGAIGRLAWQFKTFMYGAARLSYEATIKEAKAGNYKRAMRNIAHLMVTFPVAGEAVSVFRELLKDPSNFDKNMKERYGKQWRDNPLGMAFSNAGEMGAYGMFMSTVQSAQYGKTVEGFAGPTATSAGELLESGIRAGSKLPEDPEAALKTMTKWGLRHGPLSATLVYPYVKDELSLRKQGTGRGGR